jgi:hypothetical protein
VTRAVPDQPVDPADGRRFVQAHLGQAAVATIDGLEYDLRVLAGGRVWVLDLGVPR